MPEMRSISGGQIKRLQTLWGLLWKHGLGGDLCGPNSRDARLAWVAGRAGRAISSTKELTQREAKIIIDAMEKCLPAHLVQKRGPSPDRARACGIAGRTGAKSNEIQFPDVQTIALLTMLLGRLGWDRERLDLFLHSPKSPLRGRTIRTLADANKIIWVLKGMARRQAKKALTSQTEGSNQ